MTRPRSCPALDAIRAHIDALARQHPRWPWRTAHQQLRGLPEWAELARRWPVLYSWALVTWSEAVRRRPA